MEKKEKAVEIIGTPEGFGDWIVKEFARMVNSGELKTEVLK